MPACPRSFAGRIKAGAWTHIHYNFVNLTLTTLEAVFIIPRYAIQRDGALYYVEEDSDGIQRLSIIDTPELLYEGPDGVVMRLPERHDERSGSGP